MTERNWVLILLLVVCAAALCLSAVLLVFIVRQRTQAHLLSQRFAHIEETLDELRLELQSLQSGQIVADDGDALAEVATGGDDNTPDDKFREKVMAFITANYTDPSYSPTRLIEDMCMSRSLFHRKATAILGQSAGRLISGYRMEKAKEMILAHRDMNISDVAYAVGFNDPKYFTRFFTKFYGCSPSKITEETT